MKRFILIVLALCAASAYALELGIARAAKKRAAAVAAEKKPRPMDPWNAPVGPLIEGARLFDDWEDLREVAGVNVSGGWTDSVMVTQNGRRLYFGYTRYDINPIVFSTGPNLVLIQTGPPRPGMTGNAFKIFQADLGPNGWEVSYHPANNPDGEVWEAAAAVNAAEDIMVYTRFPLPSSDRILQSSLKANGAWGLPLILPFNNPACLDDNMFPVGTLLGGATVYFESRRVDPAGTVCGGTNRVFRTYYSSGTFSPVALVPVAVGEDDTQIHVSPDQRRIYWTSVRNSTYGVFTADLQPDGTYGNVRPVVMPSYAPPWTNRLGLVGEANIALVPQGELMYMMCGLGVSGNGPRPDSYRLVICRARRPR